MGSGIVEYVCVTSFSGKLADVGDVGGTVYLSKELMLLKDCVSVIRFPNIMQCEKYNGGDRVLWEKVRKPLQSVQTNHG